MRVDRVVAVVRERRVLAVVVTLLALVLAGSIVALTGDGGGSAPQGQVLRSAKRSAPTMAVEGSAGSAGATPGMAAQDEAVVGAPARQAASAAGGVGTAAAPPTPGPTASPQAPSLAAADQAGAKVVKTATMRVEVGKGKFQSAFDRAAAIAAGHGGYVAASSAATVDDRASEGTVTVRVPADQFENTRRELGALGKVQHQELSGQDVTAQIVDYDARIRSLQGQEQALSTLLSKARSVGEVLEVQGQLFNVRQQIEQLQAQRANLNAQAHLSTITLTVFDPGAALPKPTPEPATGLARSWSRAWDGAVAVIGGTVIVIGYLLPLVLMVLLCWIVWRLASRRRRPATATTPAS